MTPPLADPTAVERALGSRSADVYAGFLLPYLRPDMVVLDCGCGEGTIAIGLSDAVPAGRVIGVDLNADSLAVARLPQCTRPPYIHAPPHSCHTIPTPP